MAENFSPTTLSGIYPAAIASRRKAMHKPFAGLRISYGKTSVNFELTYKKLLRSTSAVITLARKSSISPLLPD
jgi:hypothetical protein